MKKKRANKTQPKSVKRYSWRTFIGVAAVTLLLVGIVAAISKQDGQTKKAQPAQVQKAQVGQAQQAHVEERKPEVAKQSSRHYVTQNAAGETVVLDRQTGQTRRLTPQEEQTLAEGIKQLVKPTAEGLVEVRHANGSVSMDLQGHFQNISVAKKEADGSITQSCVNDLESAAEFFEIDPALLGVSAPVSKADGPSSNPPIR